MSIGCDSGMWQDYMTKAEAMIRELRGRERLRFLQGISAALHMYSDLSSQHFGDPYMEKSFGAFCERVEELVVAAEERASRRPAP